MKLRNKKTGEIKEWSFAMLQNIMQITEQKHYNSLSDLNEEWEDYEEPKEFGYWYYDTVGNRLEFTQLSYLTEKDKELDKAIGNCFETREEAEKAVEKLKAWKRLKDKGFRFVGVRGIGKVIDFDIPEPYNHIGFYEYEANENEKEFYDDLLLIFGGEE